MVVKKRLIYLLVFTALIPLAQAALFDNKDILIGALIALNLIIILFVLFSYGKVHTVNKLISLYRQIQDKIKKDLPKEVKSQYLLEVKNLVKNFGDKEILKDVNFNVKQGEVLGLIGLNGAGKTTLLKTLIGFYSRESGEILYKGKNIDEHKNTVKKEFGFSCQDGSFYEGLSVYDNLITFGRMYGISSADIKERVDKILVLFDLKEKRDTIASELSGGMQRRLDIACAMVHYPKVLILDEPSESIDSIKREKLYKIIKKVNDLEVTVIVSTHLVEEVELICDRVCMIDEQTVDFIGDIKDVKRKYGKKLHLKNPSLNQIYEKIERSKIKKYEVPDDI